MSTVEKSIDVEVPIRVAYGQWTRFETFPRFMDGVEAVEQVDDTTLRWVATVGGRRKEWTARILQQVPDERIVWKSIDGAENGGAVSFSALSDEATRVTLRLDAEPDGTIEQAGEALGFLDRRVEGDLERFRDYVEEIAFPEDGWRGEIHAAVVEEPSSR